MYSEFRLLLCTSFFSLKIYRRLPVVQQTVGSTTNSSFSTYLGEVESNRMLQTAVQTEEGTFST